MTFTTIRDCYDEFERLHGRQAPIWTEDRLRTAIQYDLNKTYEAVTDEDLSELMDQEMAEAETELCGYPDLATKRQYESQPSAFAAAAYRPLIGDPLWTGKPTAPAVADLPLTTFNPLYLEHAATFPNQVIVRKGALDARRYTQAYFISRARPYVATTGLWVNTDILMGAGWVDGEQADEIRTAIEDLEARIAAERDAAYAGMPLR